MEEKTYCEYCGNEITSVNNLCCGEIHNEKDLDVRESNKPHRRAIPKIRLVFLIALLFQSCGRQVDPEFMPHLQAFLELAERKQVELHNVNVEIVFGKVTDLTSAICFIKTQQIIVDRMLWDAVSAAGKRTLVYHELGHCLGGLDHAGETDQSIMNPRHLVVARDYELNSELYDNDLMNRMKGTK